MSSQPTEAADARTIGQYNTDPLNKQQRGRLHYLGWKNVDIAEMTVAGALANLKAGSAKPGSKAFLKNQVNPLTGTKDVSELVGKYSNEEIEKRAGNAPLPSGVQVTVDEFTRKCQQAATEPFVMDEYTGRVTKGADPMNAMLHEMEERYCVYKDGFDKEGKPVKVRTPTRRFRFTHPSEPPVLGPAWDPVYDQVTGKRVQVGELFMVWMPVEIYQEGREKPNLERSRRMTGAIEKNKSDQMSSDGESANVTEGKFEIGKSEAYYA